MDDPLSCDESDEDPAWDGPRVVASYAADDIALAALQRRQPEALSCNACDAPIRGEPAGRGLLMWTRGDSVQLEEPPLCPRCATAIGVSAIRHWELDEEEG